MDIKFFTFEPSNSKATKNNTIHVSAKAHLVLMVSPENRNSPRSYPNHIHICMLAPEVLLCHLD